MMDDAKQKRIKEQRKLVALFFFTGAALSFALGLIINDKDLKTVLLIVGATLIAGVFIARLFKGRFGYKPTIEEIEDKQFGKPNN